MTNMDEAEKNLGPDPDDFFVDIGETLRGIVTEGRAVVVKGGRGEADSIEKLPPTAADIGKALQWVKDAKAGKAGQSELAKKLEERSRALQAKERAMPPLDTESDDAATG